jgi:uncharacterized damage-inducible protein DinB
MENLKAGLIESLRMMTDLYVRDVNALGHDGMNANLGGSSRPAYDYSYEVAIVNRRIAKRLCGEDPGQWPFEEGFVIAPEDRRNIESASDELKGACGEVCRAIESMPEERWGQVYDLGGFSMTGLQLAIHAIDHTAYHLGQLNQMQLARGDAEIHWE